MPAYGVDDYGDMIAGPVRMDAYARALQAVVRPGSVVLDIGTGTGIMALLACRLGARRVHAVEPAPVIQTAREIAAANGCGNRIEFHQVLSTQLELPEPVDVIVSDIRGVLPWYRRSLPALIDARQRFLAPGGRMVPERDDVWLAAVDAPALFERVVVPWSRNDFGFDMRAAGTLAANSVARRMVRAEQLLSRPVHCGTVDYVRATAVNFRTEVIVPVARQGTCHGFCAWFDTVLADGIGFSNAPGREELVYAQFFFRWPEAVEVDAGDTIEIRLAARLVGNDYVWSWNSQVRTGANSRRHFRQSSFLGRPMTPEMLQAISSDHVPDLGRDGFIDGLILDRMRERVPLGRIADDVAKRYPDRFATLDEALERVSEISLRYAAAGKSPR